MYKYVFHYSLLLSYILLIQFCSSNRDNIEEGDKVPAFTVEKMDGEMFSISKLKGKKVLIHFWADWCSDCRAEFPKLEKAYQKFKNDNFEIIAINVGQTGEHVQSFTEAYNLTFPMLLDEKSQIAKQFGIRGLPTNFFLDENSVITKMVIGWVDERQINQIINQGRKK